jgi:outer membrane protein OmpA-like peptidoglycan-associated protein
VVLVVVLAACSPDSTSDEREVGNGSASGGSRPSDTETPSAAPEQSELGPVVGEDCRERPGLRTRQLQDVVVPPTIAPAVTDEDGVEVLAAVTVPAFVVDAGCVIRYPAPGGCVGAVRITAATIPESRIPSSTLPAETLPSGETVAGQAFPEVVAPAVTQPGAFTPRVCQERRQDELVTVSRPGVVREGFARNGVARPGGTRPRTCDGDACVAGVVVPTIRLEPVRLPDVDVEPVRLRSRDLRGPGGVRVIRGDQRIAYVAPGSVLFATESAVIRPDAEDALDAILERIRDVSGNPRLLVEGHTDDRGSAAYGLALSRRRASAVATWLIGRGIARSRITTRGLGEAEPAVPNTSAANRARNRRVVITLELSRDR